MMQTVELDTEDWQKVMNVLGGSTGFPWTVTNPLLMLIGGQLREHAAREANRGLGELSAAGAVNNSLGASKRQRANAD